MSDVTLEISVPGAEEAGSAFDRLAEQVKELDGSVKAMNEGLASKRAAAEAAAQAKLLEKVWSDGASKVDKLRSKIAAYEAAATDATKGSEQYRKGLEGLKRQLEEAEGKQAKLAARSGEAAARARETADAEKIVQQAWSAGATQLERLSQKYVDLLNVTDESIKQSPKYADALRSIERKMDEVAAHGGGLAAALRGVFGLQPGDDLVSALRRLGVEETALRAIMERTAAAAGDGAGAFNDREAALERVKKAVGETLTEEERLRLALEELKGDSIAFTVAEKEAAAAVKVLEGKLRDLDKAAEVESLDRTSKSLNGMADQLDALGLPFGGTLQRMRMFIDGSKDAKEGGISFGGSVKALTANLSGVQIGAAAAVAGTAAVAAGAAAFVAGAVAAVAAADELQRELKDLSSVPGFEPLPPEAQKAIEDANAAFESMTLIGKGLVVEFAGKVAPAVAAVSVKALELYYEARNALEYVKEGASFAGEILRAVFEPALEAVIAAWETVRSAAGTALDYIKGTLPDVGSVGEAAAGVLKSAFVSAINAILAPLRVLVQSIAAAADLAGLDSLRDKAADTADALGRMGDGALDLLGELATSAEEHISAASAKTIDAQAAAGKLLDAGRKRVKAAAGDYKELEAAVKAVADATLQWRDATEDAAAARSGAEAQTKLETARQLRELDKQKAELVRQAKGKSDLLARVERDYQARREAIIREGAAAVEDLSREERQKVSDEETAQYDARAAALEELRGLYASTVKGIAGELLRLEDEKTNALQRIGEIYAADAISFDEFMAARVRVAEDYAKKEEEVRTAAARETEEKLSAIYRAGLDGAAAALADVADEERDRLAELDELLRAGTLSMQQYEQAKTEIVRQEAEKRKEIEVQNAIELADAMVQVVDAAGGLISDLAQRNIDASVEAIEKGNNRIANLEKALAKARTKESEAYLKAEIAREKEAIEAKRKAALTAYRIQKAVAIAQALISGALAVVKFLADPGGYVGAAMSVAAGITTAGAIAGIVATPAPDVAHTGKVPTREIGRQLEADERVTIVRDNEAVLTAQGVDALGGADAIRRANSGRGAGSMDLVLPLVYEHKTLSYILGRELSRGGLLRKLFQPVKKPGFSK